IAEQLTIVLTATLASIGAAGVPSAGIITLILVLNSVGLGTQAQAGIALVLGVDRVLDMVGTAVNVTGDLPAAAVLGGRGGGTQAQAGIALILGVDRILDMMRTAVNVTGDLTAAAFVARSEGEALVPRPVDHPIAIAPIETHAERPRTPAGQRR